MSYERKEGLEAEDRLVEEAIKELGLCYQDDKTPQEINIESEKKSPSEVAVERFRLEYGKRVRAAEED